MAFPTVVRRATAVSPTSNSTTWTASWTWGTNTAISAGEKVLWVVVLSLDGIIISAPTATGWTRVTAITDPTGACVGALFTQETTAAFAASAGPSFAMTNGSSEQYSAVMLGFKVGAGMNTGFLYTVSGDVNVATGNSANPNPDSITNTTGASQDFIIVITRSGDSTTVATAAPANYTNLQSRAGGGSNGASTNTAERQITLANNDVEDPGAFTAASEQWVAFTFGVYETGGGGAVVTRFQAHIF